jgi:rhodanese-related sulfurtransferase
MKLTDYRAFLLALAAMFFSVAVASADEIVSGYGDARDPEVLARLIEEARDEFLLIDVRSPGEYAAGHIPTAENIDYRVIGDRMADGDRDVPVVVYCRSGNRSGRAARTLSRLGYTIVDFGGISRWDGPIVEAAR